MKVYPDGYLGRWCVAILCIIGAILFGMKFGHPDNPNSGEFYHIGLWCWVALIVFSSAAVLNSKDACGTAKPACSIEADEIQYGLGGFIDSQTIEVTGVRYDPEDETHTLFVKKGKKIIRVELTRSQVGRGHSDVSILGARRFIIKQDGPGGSKKAYPLGRAAVPA